MICTFIPPFLRYTPNIGNGSRPGISMCKIITLRLNLNMNQSVKSRRDFVRITVGSRKFPLYINEANLMICRVHWSWCLYFVIRLRFTIRALQQTQLPAFSLNVHQRRALVGAVLWETMDSVYRYLFELSHLLTAEKLYSHCFFVIDRQTGEAI